MSEHKDIICPWCDTEIIWDPEFGPEDECPHCGQELTPYRNVQLHIEADEKPPGAEPEESDSVASAGAGIADLPVLGSQLAGHRTAPEPVKSKAAPENKADDDDQDGVVFYNGTVQPYIDVQSDFHECDRCRTDMVLAGRQIVKSKHFEPEDFGGLPPFLEAPFKLNVFVCPSCFKVEHALSDEDRIQAANQLRGL
ncbi:hypothetical protein [Paenibacillus sp. y28]|uniref:hypothetical protein n=1 Tax=Paenibacillus sp. y28 TaxID=3129110 RepID=UPI00301799D9